jgi:hypothetical protein
MRCENPRCGRRLRPDDIACRSCGMLRADLLVTPLALRGDEDDDELRLKMRAACPVCRADRKH